MTSRFFLEKSDEHEFIFAIQLYAEMKLLIGVIGVYRNFLVCGPLLLVVCRLIDGVLV
jgi:hypothetical protein